MSIFQNILTKLSALQAEFATAVNLEAAALADGTMVEAPAFEVGQVILVPVDGGEPIPLPAGVYDLDNKLTVTTDDMGVILAVAPTETQDAETPGTTEAAAAPAAPAPNAEAVAKKIIETQSTTREQMFSAEEIATMVKDAVAVEMAAIKDERQALTAQVEALKLELSEATAQKPMSRAPKKAGAEAAYYAEATTPTQRLLNLSQSFKTVEQS